MLVVILILILQKSAKTDDEDEPGDEPEKPNPDFQTGANRSWQRIKIKIRALRRR